MAKIVSKPKKTADKVAILGTDKTWREAPLGKSGWEVWGMNSFWESWGEYSTRWFEIHQLPILFREGWHRYKWLKKCEIPVYMVKHYSMIPNSIAYPFDEVSKGYLKEFSSTFCYQMALAIHEGFKTIGLYGLALKNGSLRERFVEYRGVLYWLGVAMGKGIEIKIVATEGNEFGHKYKYGVEYWREVIDVQMEIMRAFYACSTIDGAGKLRGIWRRLNGVYGIGKAK